MTAALNGLLGSAADGEHAVVLEEHGRRTADEFDHDFADLFTANQGKAAAGDRPAELVGHGGQYHRDGPIYGRKRGGVRRVRMHDPAYIRPVTIDEQMAGGVGRRLELALNHAPSRSTITMCSGRNAS